MKIFYSGLAVFLLSSVSTSAQQAIQVQQRRTIHPAVFQQFPNSFEVDQLQLRKVFSASIGDTLRIRLSPKHHFAGVVTDKVQPSPNLLTLNIRGLQFEGAMMHLSYDTSQEVEQALRARILHPRKGDVMVLVLENNKYLFRKEEQQFFLAE
jgi:hypothetical protein